MNINPNDLIRKTLGNPNLLQYTENIQMKGLLVLAKIAIPQFGALVDTHEKAVEDIKKLELANILSELQEEIQKIKEIDAEFVKSSEFESYISQIFQKIQETNNSIKRHLYVNLLVNGLSQKIPINQKFFYLRTLNDLTEMGVDLYSFFTNPLQYCTLNKKFPAKRYGMGASKDILLEIFSEYPEFMIRQTVFELSRAGIIKEEVAKLNGQYNTIYMIQSEHSEPESDPAIQQLISKFNGSLTEYGTKFSEFLIKQ
ncbi:MAG: hypothetical protein AABX51_02445 [Nanoarchaeota archaeon]